MRRPDAHMGFFRKAGRQITQDSTLLHRYGYRPEAYAPTPEEPHASSLLLPGRVTELRREQYTVMTDHGEVTAVLKGSFLHGADDLDGYPCVGDFVRIRHNDSGVSWITELLPRLSKFSRANYSGHAAGYVKTIREQVVAANFDYVFILSSLNLDFNVHRILRYVTQALGSGGSPVVLLTKADLLGRTTIDETGAGSTFDDVADRDSSVVTGIQASAEADAQTLRLSDAVAAVSRSAPGVPVHAISSLTGYGLEALDGYLQPGKTAVFLGMSGVGKSSLLNVLMQREVMTVKGIRTDDSRGRHTTTHRQLFMLPSGAMVIDTPGMRELGLFDAEVGIQAGFTDVEAVFDACRFRDCGHNREPGCAVRAALADGSLSGKRWEQYQAQRGENRFVEDRTGYLRDKRAWQKSIAMRSKQMGVKQGKHKT